MNNLKAIKIACLGSVAAMLMTPALSIAETTQSNATVGAGGHSLVHRVSHSLADSKAYTHTGSAGYKWGKSVQRPQTDTEWSDNHRSQGGYKWGNSATSDKPSSDSYAGASSYQWGSMSFSDQSAYRWGIRSFSDQSAYRWGIRSFSDQSAYRWGIRSFSDQSAYRWGIRSISDQSAYRWGIR